MPNLRRYLPLATLGLVPLLVTGDNGPIVETHKPSKIAVAELEVTEPSPQAQGKDSLANLKSKPLHINNSDPVAAMKNACKKLGIDFDGVFEKTFNEIVQESKAQLESTNALIPNPNREQTIDMAYTVGNIIIKKLPFHTETINRDTPTEEQDVRSIFSGIRDGRSDCDTRAMLIIAVLNKLGIKHSLHTMIMPGHAALCLLDNPTSPSILETNGGEFLLSTHLGNYHQMLGPKIDIKRVRVMDIATESYAFLKLAQDTGLDLDTRIAAFDNFAKDYKGKKSFEQVYLNLLPLKIEIIIQDYKTNKDPKRLTQIEEAYLETGKLGFSPNDYITNAYAFVLNEQGKFNETIAVVERFLASQKGSHDQLTCYRPYFKALVETKAPQEKVREAFGHAIGAGDRRTLFSELDKLSQNMRDTTSILISHQIKELKTIKQLLDQTAKHLKQDAELQAKRKAREGTKDESTLTDKQKERLERTRKFLEETIAQSRENHERHQKEFDAKMAELAKVNFDQETPENNMDYARLLFSVEKYPEALKRLEHVLKLYPDNYDASELRLGILARTANHEELLKTANAILAKYPNDGHTLYTLGTHYARNKDWDKALEYFKQASRALPTYHWDAALKLMQKNPAEFGSEQIAEETLYLKQNFPGLAKSL